MDYKIRYVLINTASNSIEGTFFTAESLAAKLRTRPVRDLDVIKYVNDDVVERVSARHWLTTDANPEKPQ